MKRINLLMGLLLLIGSIALNSCKKSETSGTMYAVRMTDAPAPYSAVNIDLQGVQVIGSIGTASLSTHAGIYNLLALSNGLDTLIASGNINVGTVQQVKLILGSNNSVTQNGVSTALNIATGADGGLTLNVNHTIQTGSSTSLLIDFDANQSVTAQAGGTFSFNPVIRPVSLTTTTTTTTGTSTTITTGVGTGTSATAAGSISGQLGTANILASVSASGAGGSFSSGVSNGSFMIQGLTAGTYSLTITPAFPLQPVTIPNVTVNSGATTNVGLVAF